MMSRLFLNLHEAVTPHATAQGVLDSRRTITLLFATPLENTQSNDSGEEVGYDGTPDRTSSPPDTPGSNMLGEEHDHPQHRRSLDDTPANENAFELQEMRDGRIV